jgi:hypothetical protein
MAKLEILTMTNNVFLLLKRRCIYLSLCLFCVMSFFSCKLSTKHKAASSIMLDNLCNVEEIEIKDVSLFALLDSILIFSDKCLVDDSVYYQYYIYTLFFDFQQNKVIHVSLVPIPLSFSSPFAYYGCAYFRNKRFLVYSNNEELLQNYFFKTNRLLVFECSIGRFPYYKIGRVSMQNDNVFFDFKCEEINLLIFE